MTVWLKRCDTVSGCGKTYPGDLTQCPHCDAPEWASTPALINPRDYSYDIETYPNTFTARFIHLATDQRWSFEISDRINQIQEFIEFIHYLISVDARGVGYNNIGFDYPVIHWIVANPWVSVEHIYDYAMQVINSRDPFAFMLWPRDWLFVQIDLFKIHHYNNKAKSTSLKALEIAMRMQSVEDLPFPVGTHLTPVQQDKLHTYNDHDCVATAQFYVRSLPAIKLREGISESLGIDVLNDSDSKMGEKILIRELEQQGIMTRQNGVKLQTFRAEIDLNECVFDYITFQHPAFNAVLGWFKRQVITETKGVFHDIDVTPDLLPHLDFNSVKVHGLKKRPVKLSRVEPGVDVTNYRMTADNLHVVVDGVKYDFGTGGLHASIHNKTLVTTETHQIVDVDVASYYPNLAIKNRMYPRHFSDQFCYEYERVYKTRKTFKKGTPENGAYKLALNATYGNSNNEHSVMYDPKYTMTTTINGQLLLCVFTEQLLRIPGLSMIQANTDGVTFYCPVEYLEHSRAVCRWWEELTHLELEEALYSRMWIRDVNSYMAEYESGGIKRIGAYAHRRQCIDPGTREAMWHKDPSALVIPMAAEAQLVRGIPARVFIESHDDWYDFAIRAKVPRSCRLVMRWDDLPGVEQDLPNTSRYYIVNDGGSLHKIEPPRGEPGTWKRRNGVSDAYFQSVMAELSQMQNADSVDINGTPHDERIHTKNRSKYDTVTTGLSVGWMCREANQTPNDWQQHINYDYYVAEAQKLIDGVVSNE